MQSVKARGGSSAVGVLDEPMDFGVSLGGRRVVVHLGNVGYGIGSEVPAKKTADYARRFPGFMFVGVDLKEYMGMMVDNWTQIRSNFREGLEGLADGSVDLISSDLALGHYDSKGTDPMDAVGDKAVGSYGRAHKNTLDTVRVAYRKLRKGGKMTLAVGSSAVKPMPQILEEAGFRPDKVSVRKLDGREYGRTFWTYNFQIHGAVWQINAEK
jgi:hypothetical protein